MADDLFETSTGWEWWTLGGICAAGGGNVQTGPFGSQLHASDYVVGGIPSVMPMNIGDNRILSEGIAQVSIADAERLGRHRMRVGDIVYSRRGDVDRRAIVRHENTGWLCGTGCLRVRAGNRVFPEFLAVYLGHPRVREWIRRHAVGATMPNLNTGILEALPVVVPPMAEQRAIASIIGALDDKIELNRRTNETLEGMARVLFKSWFIDFDPVRAKANGRLPSGMDSTIADLFPSQFERREAGELPRGWQWRCLENLTSKIGSGATPRGGDKAYVDDGVTLIRSQNVYDSKFVWEGLVRLTTDDSDRLAGVTVMRGDVLLNITGASILRTCIVEPDVLPARVNQHVAIVRARDGIPPSYIHQHLLQRTTKDYLLGMDAGASRQAVTKGHIESVPIVLPSSGVLDGWRRLTAPLFSAVSANDSQSRTLTAARDTLLPRLLSGELSVRSADRLVEAIA